MRKYFLYDGFHIQHAKIFYMSTEVKFDPATNPHSTVKFSTARPEEAKTTQTTHQQAAEIRGRIGPEPSEILVQTDVFENETR